jgi:hypothetical protein
MLGVAWFRWQVVGRAPETAGRNGVSGGEGIMFFSTTRGVMRPVVGGTVALALLVPAAGVAQAAPVQQGSASVAAAATTSAAGAQAQKVVRSNEYGKARSTVRGTFGKAGSVTGNFTPRRFKVNKAGDVVGVGRLVAKLTRGNGNVVGKVTQRAKVPVMKVNGAPLGARAAAAAVSCRILRLILGPLDLNLLGLRVQLNRVRLRITAIPGPGNLLGNLLCGVAGLLDSGLTPRQLSQILTAISQILKL